MKTSIFYLAFFLLIVTACISAKKGDKTSLTIDLEQGINGHTPREHIQTFAALLGPPEELIDEWKQKDGSEYYHYYSKGVGLLVVKDSVQTIFYYFQSKRFKTFNGKVLQGLSNQTNIDDVKKLYGEPEETFSHVAMGRSDFPDAQETSLSYHNKRGLTFTFYNNKLGDIRQSRGKIQ